MSPRWTAGVRRTVLANGLTVLIEPLPDTPAVAVVTHVRAGFLDEPDRWGGISHVLEHMYFKGTATRGPGLIAQAIKAAGGYVNAGTGYDFTVYYAVLPAAAMATAIEVQADAIRHPAIDADELARELQVIIEEARRKRDTPGDLAHETLHAVLFDHHRLRRWRIGEEDRLAGFTREDLLGYYRTRYLPGRTIVAVVGGVDADAALEQVANRFGDWPAGLPALDPPVDEPWRREVRARTIRGDVADAQLVLGWRAPPVLDSARPALEMAATLLATGRSAWLNQALRQPGVVTGVGAGLLTTDDAGVFSIGAELAPERIDEALQVTGATLDRLRRRGPSAEDLDRARTMIRARWARWLESAESRAAAYAYAESVDGVDWLDRAYDDLLAVDAAAVGRVAEAFLAPEAVAAVAYLPNGAGTDLTPDSLRRAFAPRAPGNRPTRVAEFSVLALPALDLIVRRKSGAGLVTLRLHRRRRTLEAAAQAGVGLLAVRSAVRGAGGLDADGLAAAFERLGGPVSATATADAFGFGATVLASHLDTAAGLLAAVMREPTHAEATVEVERGVLRREVEQVRDDMFRFPFQLALAAAFGDRGYGLPAGGTAESVEALSQGAVRSWLETELEGGRGLLAVVGDVDPERVAEELAERFHAWPAPSHQAPPPLPTAVPGTGYRWVELARHQTALAMVFPGPARRDPRRFAAEVWAAAAGGLGGRLFERLRDHRSLAYTVLATSWQRLGAGALLTYIATSPGREDEAREQMLAELAGFRAGGLTADEQARAVAYLAGQAVVSRQSGSAIAADLVDAWLADDPLDSFEDPGAPYRAVTSESVQAVVVASLDPGLRSEGGVRGVGSPR